MLNALVLAAVWLVDDSKTRIPTRVLRMTLDQAFVRPEDVRAEVARRLGHDPIAVVVEQVDFVRETTVVAVRHKVEEGWARLSSFSDTANIEPPSTDGSAWQPAPQEMSRAPVPDLTGLESRRLISLPEVLASAPATTRVDRKYLVFLERGEHFLAQLPGSLRLLSINGRLTTSYRSTYFDTADLLTCRAHIQGRRRRWKARSRLYVEDGLCRLELKVRDGAGSTRSSSTPRHRKPTGR